MEEIVTMNGSSFKIWYNSPNDRMRAIESLQANLAQNPGFETVSPVAQYQPANWASVINSGTAVFPYNSPQDIPGRTGKGAAIVASGVASAYWAQMVTGISGGTSYTLTAYAQTTNVTGGYGAFIEIDWFAGTTFLSATTSPPKTGSVSWSQLTVTGTAPSTATAANIILILNGSGNVVYDDVSFTAGGAGCTPGVTPCSPTCLTGYCPTGQTCSSNGTCVSSGGCTPGVTPCSPTCLSGYCPTGQVCSSNGTCISSGGCTPGVTPCSPTCLSGFCPSGQVCSSTGVCTSGGGGGGGCSPACTSTQSCIFGTCIEKNYIKYGAIGFGALFILSILKK